MWGRVGSADSARRSGGLAVPVGGPQPRRQERDQGGGTVLLAWIVAAGGLLDWNGMKVGGGYATGKGTSRRGYCCDERIGRSEWITTLPFYPFYKKINF